MSLPPNFPFAGQNNPYTNPYQPNLLQQNQQLNPYQPNLFQPNLFQQNQQPNLYHPNPYQQPNPYQPNLYHPNPYQQPNPYQPNPYLTHLHQPLGAYFPNGQIGLYPNLPLQIPQHIFHGTLQQAINPQRPENLNPHGRQYAHITGIDTSKTPMDAIILEGSSNIPINAIIVESSESSEESESESLERESEPLKSELQFIRNNSKTCPRVRSQEAIVKLCAVSPRNIEELSKSLNRAETTCQEFINLLLRTNRLYKQEVVTQDLTRYTTDPKLACHASNFS